MGSYPGFKGGDFRQVLWTGPGHQDRLDRNLVQIALSTSMGPISTLWGVKIGCRKCRLAGTGQTRHSNPKLSSQKNSQQIQVRHAHAPPIPQAFFKLKWANQNEHVGMWVTSFRPTVLVYSNAPQDNRF